MFWQVGAVMAGYRGFQIMFVILVIFVLIKVLKGIVRLGITVLGIGLILYLLNNYLNIF